MAKIYADLIRKGLKTLDQVPEKIREEVRALIKETNDASIHLPHSSI